MSLNDQYIVFADIVNKITRSSGKVHRPTSNLYALHLSYVLFHLHPMKVTPILMALSTNAMLLLDQKTLQIKYRIPATEIYRLSLSPYHDNIAVFHLRDVSRHFNAVKLKNKIRKFYNYPEKNWQSEMGRKKGDFVFQTAHVIEVITKLFLVIQNATGRQPEICIDSE